ncbi:hypothetical protein [Vibrio metschnikovii]|uniref:hypothetical protein n=1 Tax=Vibrio metschnikovii TaxID=28172 RepID=UPI00339D7E93
MKIETTFLTCANSKYAFFVPIYVYFVLKYNKDARVEVLVDNQETLLYLNDFIIWINEKYPERTLVRAVNFEGVTPNIVRFLEEPLVKTKYTYIADIDILVVDNVTSWHVKKMEELNLPHSNIIRKGQERLTGLHFCETIKHYPVLFDDFNIKSNKSSTDEEFLYFTYKIKNKLPPITHTKRPEHGIHISINRCPYDKKGWGMNEVFFERTLETINEILEDNIAYFFPEKSLWMLNLVKQFITGKSLFESNDLESFRFLKRTEKEQKILDSFYNGELKNSL